MRTITRIVLLSMGLCIFLGSCQILSPHNGPDSPEAPEKAVAMGRYVEVPLAVPEGLSYPWVFDQVDEGEYYILGECVGDSDPQVWHSANGGESWERQFPGWLADCTGGDGSLSFIQGAFTSEGGIYLFYQRGYWREDDAPVYEDHFIYAHDEQSVELPLREGWQIDSIALPGVGGILLTVGEEILYCNDAMEVLHAFPRGRFVSADKTLAIRNAEGNLSLYDLVSGELTGEISCVQPVNHMAYQADKDAYLYTSDSGLYRISPDGLITEQLVDGRLSSLGVPHFTVFRLLADGDAFLALLRDGDSYQLIKFVFDAEISTKPATQLTIYSLRDNLTMRTAGHLFSQRNPDILVDFQTGLEEGGAVTVSDALLSLSTQLLANAGPDILVLDGLPYPSYADKGLLLDLQDLGAVRSGELFPNLVDAYRESSGELRALPVKFQLPLLIGEGLESGGTVGHAVEWLEQQAYPLAADLGEDVPGSFYPLCSWRWFGKDETVDYKALAEDLEAVKAFISLQSSMERPEYLPQYDDPLNQCFWWATDRLAMVLTPVKDISAFNDVYSALLIRENAEALLMSGEDGALFLPAGILGVNAGSEHLDAARSLVQFTLEDEVQAIPLYDGLPVNRIAFEGFLRQRELGDSTYLLTDVNHRTGEEIHYNGIWPNEDALHTILEMADSATVPALSDEILRKLVLETARDYFQGAASLEQTVEAIGGKLQRYWDERG